MKATLLSSNGVGRIVENPHELLIDVAEGGETIPSFTIRLVGGKLTVDGSITIKIDSATAEAPGLVIGGDDGPAVCLDGVFPARQLEETAAWLRMRISPNTSLALTVADLPEGAGLIPFGPMDSWAYPNFAAVSLMTPTVDGLCDAALTSSPHAPT